MDPGETIIGLDFGNHLWVVLSLPFDGVVAMVNITTHGRSPACGEHCTVIQPGEHPFVTRPSCVYFRKASLNPVEPLRAARDQRSLNLHAPFSAELLRRVQEATLESRLVIPSVKTAVERTLNPTGTD